MQILTPAEVSEAEVQQTQFPLGPLSSAPPFTALRAKLGLGGGAMNQDWLSGKMQVAGQARGSVSHCSLQRKASIRGDSDSGTEIPGHGLV